METASQLEKFSRNFLQSFSNSLCCSESCALSKLNWKRQKSIANINSQLQTPKFEYNFWEQMAISVCFCCCSERKRREIVTMNLRSHATLRIEHFHQKAMFIKVHLDFVHEFQVQLKGVVPKNKGHTNFYEHCDLRKEYIYAEILVFWRRSWSSNWLLGVPIDFHWLQLTLLNPHDSLQVKWIAKIFQNFCQKFFQFTFSLQLTLLNCTWSGPKSDTWCTLLSWFGFSKPI